MPALRKTRSTTATQEEPKQAQAESPKKSGTASGKKGLSVGDSLPTGLEVVNESGESLDLSSLYASHGLVLFFYPRANTPGCTNQACGFRDHFAEFEKKGYCVYGMSADPPTSQLSWKSKYHFPYGLLSDRSKDRHALKLLGVNKAPSSVLRSHLIIAKGGVVEQVAYGITPKESVQQAVDFIQAI